MARYLLVREVPYPRRDLFPNLPVMANHLEWHRNWCASTILTHLSWETDGMTRAELETRFRQDVRNARAQLDGRAPMGTMYDSCTTKERREAAEDYLRQCKYGVEKCTLILEQLEEAGFVTKHDA
jgi:hypothetical protein